MSTIFSKIISGEIPCYKIAENDHFFAFLDIKPMAKGHVLVVPKKETDYVFDLEDIDLSQLILFSKKIAVAIKKAITCKRVGMMVVGMEVPHAHIHLIPINKETDMSLTNQRLSIKPEELQAIAENIAKNI